MKSFIEALIIALMIGGTAILLIKNDKAQEHKEIANSIPEPQHYAYPSVICKFHAYTRTTEGLALEYDVATMIETPPFYDSSKLMKLTAMLHHEFIKTSSKMYIKDHHDLTNNYCNDLKQKGFILEDIRVEPTEASRKLIQSVLQPELTH